MKPQDKKIFSSKQLLEKIGITDQLTDGALGLLDDEEDALSGNLVPLLKERYHQLKRVSHPLQPGMAITWKPGLKNRRWPAYGAPAVVVEMLEAPVFDTDESGSTYFREPLDMIIGVFIDAGEHRGDFLVFHANSQRYQPLPGEEV